MIFRKARLLGIEVKMITGDQTAIAKETARTLHMGTEIHKADALMLPPGVADDSIEAQQLNDLVETDHLLSISNYAERINVNKIDESG